ncbi:MAG: hypothetical protein MZU91_05560 [Desulfosudis oleivorans]|nr:hypothetical protein [Desulfosudis oleivorans]
MQPLKPPTLPINTGNILNSIMGSDLDRDGSVSKLEILIIGSQMQQQVDYLTVLKDFLPFWGDFIDSAINNIQQKLAPLALMANNFELFSKNGAKTDAIEGEDIISIIEAAKGDGDVYSFTEDDLNAFKGTPLTA